MRPPIDTSPDDLLIRATCSVIVNDKVVGTAWLVSSGGYLLTAGHLLDIEPPSVEVKICFRNSTTRIASKIHLQHEQNKGIDFAVLKIDDVPIDCVPLPISLTDSATGSFKSYGYGKSLTYLSPGEGKILGTYFWLDSEDYPLLSLDSKQLGEGGYSGAAIFSVELQKAVALQIKATIATTGAGRDTILAMPLSRIAQLWTPLAELATEERRSSPSRRILHPKPRDLYLEWRLKDVSERLRTSLYVAPFEDVYRQSKDATTPPQSIDLSLTEYLHATRPWTYQSIIPNCPPETFTSFSAAFECFEQRVLLLGDPGSGKTTTLYSLTKKLAEDAQADQEAPIPLLFNLSDWEDDTQPIADWLIMMTAKLPGAGVTEDVAQLWVDEDNVALLLDGLDEVDEDRRAKLVNALNAYFSKHPKMPTVVCSRSADYAELQSNQETRLRLNGAIALNPLTREQIDAYLTAAGAVTLREVVFGDAEMYELARTPLTLSMMTLAYGNIPPHEFPLDLPRLERRQDLFDAYVNYMMRRKARRDADLPFDRNATEEMLFKYDRRQVNRYLGWLAIRLSEQARTTFPLGGIFSFLENAPDQGLVSVANFANITNAITMGIIGIIMGLVWFMGETQKSPALTALVVPVTLLLVVMIVANFVLHQLTKQRVRTSRLRISKILYFVAIHVATSATLDRWFFSSTWLEAIGHMPIITLTSLIVSGGFNAVFNRGRGTARFAGLVGAIGGLVVVQIVGRFAGSDLGVFVKILLGVICGLLSSVPIIWYSRRNEHFIEDLLNLIARWLLRMRRYIPGDFPSFLNYAADALLLQKVERGAQYKFTHNLLRDYFALLELMPRLKAADEQVRMLTVKRLSRLGETAREALLVAAENDESIEVRQLATQSLAKLVSG